MSDVTADDDDLVQRTARGEEAAFRLLVTRWEGPVYAFLYHMLGSVEEAEDMAQEAFIRIHAQAGRYRPEGRFRAWLFRIAGNLARSELRRRRVLRWIRFDAQSHDRPDPGPAPDGVVVAAEARQQVLGALDELPARQRQALVLRRYQGLTHQEIAQALGTTPAAVEGLLHRAMGALRERLGGRSSD